MSKNRAVAQEIADVCRELGWTYQVRGSVLEIRKAFTPGSLEEFSRADSEYYSILGLVPTTAPGSMWGTDGSGMGAVGAVQRGLFSMKKSGCNKLVLRALEKLA